MFKIPTSFRWILILCILLPSAGCNHSGIIRSYKWDPEKHTDKDIKKFFVLHKGRWWNYYERGLAFMAGGYWGAAIKDFDKALKQMPDDQHDARTYGLNRIDYYVNRERGIAHLKRMQYKKARRFLTDSLKTVETHRTQYYLRQLVKKHPNTVQPTIRLTDPEPRLAEDGIETVKVESRVVKLRILIEDKNFIHSIWLDDKELFFQLGKPRFEFIVNQKLDYGVNFIEIKETNFADKETKKRFRLIRTEPSKQDSFQNKFIARPTARKSNVLVETVAYSAISRNTASLMRFAAKGGYNLLNLSHTSDISSKRNEQPSDLPIDEDNANQILLSEEEKRELLPPDERYRILPIPFKLLCIKKRLPSGRYLHEVLYEELGQALKKNDRFSYIDLDKNALTKILGLDNDSRFKPKVVKEVVKEYLEDRGIDGILIGNISKEKKEKEIPGRVVKAFLHDLGKGEKQMLRVEHGRKFGSDEVVSPFAVKIIKLIVNKFPFKAGKVTRVTTNQFVCTFELAEVPLMQNMKLMIFEPDHDMDCLDAQATITRVTERKKKKKQNVKAQFSKNAKNEVVQEGDIVITR